jgi:serpin B
MMVAMPPLLRPLLVLVLAAGCASPGAPIATPAQPSATPGRPAATPSPPASTRTPALSTPGAVAILPGVEFLDRGPRDVADVPLDDIRAIAAARNQFALDIFGILAQADGNVVLGPDSISNALSMLYAGAGGQTADHLRDHMHLPLPDEQLHAAAGALDASLLEANEAEGIELLRGTQLFGQAGYTFGEPFLETVSRRYGAPLAAVDFVGRPEVARTAINDWVAELTRELIEELMPAGSIDPSTVLVLVDAQYMKATWRTQFDPEQTRSLPFHLEDGTTQDVPMMTAMLDIPYAEGVDWTAAELPYAGDRLAMVVVVPDDLAAFEATLTADSLAGLIDQLVVPDEPVRVELPRFETRQHSGLLEVLADLGITDLSDLSGIAPGVFVSAIEHEAVVKVNEEGTEAAAATGIAVAECACPHPELRADRPFLFFVRDQLTGSILFMGRVADPT